VDADDFRSALTNPQGYVFQLTRAQLAGDTATVEQLMAQIDRAGLWQLVALIAVAELGHELGEHRGDLADAWLAERLRHGLDPEPG
jgi:hypothetical protein